MFSCVCVCACVCVCVCVVVVSIYIKGHDLFAVLQCPEPLVVCVGSQNPLNLLAAQSAIVETMERQWYGRYIASLTVEEKKKKKEEETGDAEPVKKTVEHTVVHMYMYMWALT